MAESLRLKILNVFRDRLEVISTSNGFLTDASLVLRGENPVLGPDDPNAIVLIPGEDISPDDSQGMGTGDGANLTQRWTIGVQAAVIDDPSIYPLVLLENMIADIKTAMEQPDRTLGDLVHGFYRSRILPMERKEGTDVVGAIVEYDILFTEVWGDPTQ